VAGEPNRGHVGDGRPNHDRAIQRRDAPRRQRQQSARSGARPARGALGVPWRRQFYGALRITRNANSAAAPSGASAPSSGASAPPSGASAPPSGASPPPSGSADRTSRGGWRVHPDVQRGLRAGDLSAERRADGASPNCARASSVAGCSASRRGPSGGWRVHADVQRRLRGGGPISGRRPTGRGAAGRDANRGGATSRGATGRVATGRVATGRGATSRGATGRRPTGRGATGFRTTGFRATATRGDGCSPSVRATGRRLYPDVRERRAAADAHAGAVRRRVTAASCGSASRSASHCTAADAAGRPATTAAAQRTW